MLQQKRIRKPPMPLAIYYPLSTNKPRNTKTKKKIRRCTYQTISYPSKFISASKIYSVYADLAILEHENNLVFEPSLLSRFMKCDGINIIPMPSTDQKLISIQLEKKKGLKIPHWSQIIKKLKATKDPHLIEGARLVQNFCEGFEKNMEMENSSQSINTIPLNNDSQTNLKTKNEIEQKRLLENFPCVYFKSSISEGRPGFSEIIFNQSLIEGLGYSLDQFTSAVLYEGIPQLMSFDSKDNGEILKILLENYFKLKNQSYKTTQLSSSLFTKDNFIKDITFQAHFFPVKCGEKIGVDIIIAILDIEDHVYQEEGRIPRSRINRNYAEKSLLTEEERNYFISSYYMHLIPSQVINPDKVCRIKELAPSPDHDFFEKIEAAKSEEF